MDASHVGKHNEKGDIHGASYTEMNGPRKMTEPKLSLHEFTCKAITALKMGFGVAYACVQSLC